MKKIILTGNVGRDPEVRADNAGNSFTVFSVGVVVGTKVAPKTDWVDVSCNNKLAEIVNSYVKKGSKLLIEGFPTASAYINKENKAVATLKVFASNIEFLSSKHEDSASSHTDDDVPKDAYNAVAPNSTTLTDDDIPF